jgi:hypothetical protein
MTAGLKSKRIFMTVGLEIKRIIFMTAGLKSKRIFMAVGLEINRIKKGPQVLDNECKVLKDRRSFIYLRSMHSISSKQA